MSGLGDQYRLIRIGFFLADRPAVSRQDRTKRFVESLDGKDVRRQICQGIDPPRDQLDLLVIEDARGHHPAELADIEAVGSRGVGQENRHVVGPPHVNDNRSARSPPTGPGWH